MNSDPRDPSHDSSGRGGALSRHHQRALDLQLDALLGEALGVLPAADLPARLRATLAEQAHRTSPSRPMLLAAALLALAVVGTLSWWRNGERGAFVPVQEPKPAPQAPERAADVAQDPKAAPVRPEWITVIADYSDNKVSLVDQDGKVLRQLDEVFGAWDAELLPNGNLLVTEFSVSRVREITPAGAVVWNFEGLKNPYDADRLPDGNTLIADTFGGRVIEVSPTGEVLWEYLGTRPFDADRLPNGNTLIADIVEDRVIEVDREGKLVWQARGLPNLHDADRLPNGNTLVTLRGKGAVVEIDRNGKVVWELKGLSSPSDADRLPNGNTLVAENTKVCEYDTKGKVVWTYATTWAVECNRYYRKAAPAKEGADKGEPKVSEKGAGEKGKDAEVPVKK